MLQNSASSNLHIRAYVVEPEWLGEARDAALISIAKTVPKNYNRIALRICTKEGDEIPFKQWIAGIAGTKLRGCEQ